MRARQVLLGGLLFAGAAFAAALQACGGDTTVAAPAVDASTGDVAPEDASDAGAPDSEPPCAPPSDPSKSALCVRVAPEGIKFLTDLSFDGKGVLAVDVHATSNPDLPDGGPVPPLAAAIFPEGGVDAGEVDLSAPLPVARFDGLPPTVYPRVIFVDSRVQPKPAAGWWIGGYDLSHGLDKPPLQPVALTAGQGTTITIDLVALRALVVTLTLGTAPVGNAMGPAWFLVTADRAPLGSNAFGIGASACAKVNGGSAAVVTGFVFGKGPYWVFADLDDFGDSGVLGPGSLTTLAFEDGGVENPQTAQISYVPSAYVVSTSQSLQLAVPRPDAGADLVSCP